MDVTFEGKTETGKDEWLTPPDLLANFKTFSLDPCSPINRPWPTAKTHFTKNDNGLLKDWGGGAWYIATRRMERRPQSGLKKALSTTTQ